VHFLNLDNAFGMPILKKPFFTVSYINQLKLTLIISAQFLHQNTQAHQYGATTNMVQLNEEIRL
jgi:hypothetical protein